jgi:hypothetical protein
MELKEYFKNPGNNSSKYKVLYSIFLEQSQRSSTQTIAAFDRIGPSKIQQGRRNKLSFNQRAIIRLLFSDESQTTRSQFEIGFRFDNVFSNEIEQRFNMFEYAKSALKMSV